MRHVRFLTLFFCMGASFYACQPKEEGLQLQPKVEIVSSKSVIKNENNELFIHSDWPVVLKIVMPKTDCFKTIISASFRVYSYRNTLLWQDEITPYIYLEKSSSFFYYIFRSPSSPEARKLRLSIRLEISSNDRRAAEITGAWMDACELYNVIDPIPIELQRGWHRSELNSSGVFVQWVQQEASFKVRPVPYPAFFVLKGTTPLECFPDSRQRIRIQRNGETLMDQIILEPEFVVFSPVAVDFEINKNSSEEFSIYSDYSFTPADCFHGGDQRVLAFQSQEIWLSNFIPCRIRPNSFSKMEYQSLPEDEIFAPVPNHFSNLYLVASISPDCREENYHLEVKSNQEILFSELIPKGKFCVRLNQINERVENNLLRLKVKTSPMCFDIDDESLNWEDKVHGVYIHDLVIGD